MKGVGQMSEKKDFLDILILLLKAEIIEVKIKVNLPPGFLAKLDEATADKLVEGPELAELIELYRGK